MAAVYLAVGITAFRVPERVTTARARHLLTSNGSTHMTLRTFTSVGLVRIAAATGALDSSPNTSGKRPIREMPGFLAGMSTQAGAVRLGRRVHGNVRVTLPGTPGLC
jgi:hypothetical protein